MQDDNPQAAEKCSSISATTHTTQNKPQRTSNPGQDQPLAVIVSVLGAIILVYMETAPQPCLDVQYNN